MNVRVPIAVLSLMLLSHAALAAQSGSMRPGITREVTTTTTDPATYADLGGQISWRNGTASPKTEILPGCDNTINGLTIAVVDGQGTAASYPINVSAAAGTVGGVSSVPITANNQGIIFACDGSVTNWALAGTLPGGGPIVFPQIVSEQACPATITGSGSSTVFTPICGTSTITITANGQTINVPSNMPGANGMAGYTIDILYGGNFTPPTFGPGTQWQNKTVPAPCGTTTTGCLSGVSGAHDRLVGQSLDAADILYGPPITNYGAPPVWTFVNAGSCVSSSGPVCTTGQVNMTGADLIVYVYSWYNGGGATFTNATDSSSNTYTNTITQAGGNQTLKCGYVQAPTVTSTMTFSAAVTGTPYNAMSVAGFKGSVSSPLDKFNSTGAASGTTLNTGATGTPVQNGELMAACVGLSASGAGTTSGTSIDSSYTLVGSTNAAAGSNNGTAIGYLFQGTAASSNPAFSWTASAGTSGASAGIMTFK